MDRQFEHFPPDHIQNDYIVKPHVFTLWIHESEYQDIKRWCVDNGLEIRLVTYLGNDFHMRVTTRDDNRAMLFKLTWA